MTQPANRPAALARLDVLVGEWSEEAGFGDAPAGRTTIEWALGERFLVERSTIPHPDFPDTLSIIALNADGSGYTKHYFDSRGIARLYKMTLEGNSWTLVRDEADFTTLEFSQRFVGTIADDGSTITGSWESADDGRSWRKDFDLVYRRLDNAVHG